MSEFSGGGTVPTSIRLPRDILEELPFLAVYNHKISVSELLREWVVRCASADMHKAGYAKVRSQLLKATAQRANANAPQ